MRLLELAWRELLLPQWSRLQDVLSADVAVRGTALAADDLATVLATCHLPIDGWLSVHRPARPDL